MKICIIGAGAIGGFIGTRLALSTAAQNGNIQVSALARGVTLTALQTQGWRLNMNGALLQTSAVATSNAVELGEQDLIIITVKAQSLAVAVQSIAPLLGKNTVVMPAMNGVPWWFCKNYHGFESPLTSLDPQGAIAAAIDYHRVLGCVVHASTACPEAGLVTHKMGQGLIIGEPNGEAQEKPSERCQAVTNVLSQAGFDVTRSAHIRYDIWYKLWGNMTMNPVSAMTGATADKILADPLVRGFCSAVMAEAAAIGAHIGCDITQAPEARHTMTAKLGAFKTSMLQDVEANRPIELDAIVGAAFEIGQRLGLRTPNIAALLGLTRLFAQEKQLY